AYSSGNIAIVEKGQYNIREAAPVLELSNHGAGEARPIHHHIAGRAPDGKRMGAVGGLGVVAEAVDSFRHLLRKYAIRGASMAFGPHRRGRGEKAGPPWHTPLARRCGLARDHRLPAALDDQPRRRGARGAAIDAARVDVPIARSVLGMPFAHQCDRRTRPPMTRPCVPYRRGKGPWR